MNTDNNKTVNTNPQSLNIRNVNNNSSSPEESRKKSRLLFEQKMKDYDNKYNPGKFVCMRRVPEPMPQDTVI